MAILNEKPGANGHYKDWPNTQGFDVKYEERSPVELQVEGHIPHYAAGVLFRTGLGPREVDTVKGTTFKVNHWFDNLAQIHRFQIHEPDHVDNDVKVTYNSRLVCDGLIEQIRKTGDRQSLTFGARYDPCMSFFQKLQSTFRASKSARPDELSVAVTMSANFPGLSKEGKKLEESHATEEIATLCNKTDAAVLQMMDPVTLEPIGIADQAVLHPLLTGPMSAAHAQTDPATGDVYNFNLAFGRKSTYRVFTVSATSGKTSILATINHTPAYIHSMFLTKKYIILCVWNSFIRGSGAAILWKRNIVDALAEFDQSKPAKWFVVDKRPAEDGGKGLVATYDSDAFFSFHGVNAYEEASPSVTGGEDIVLDVSAYDNLDCIKRFYLQNMLSDSASARAYSDPSNSSCRPKLRRYRLPNVFAAPSKDSRNAILEHISGYSITPELPTINPSVATKKHRFIYGILDSGKSTFADSLIKYDTSTHATQTWSVHGHTAGEPIFVADPKSESEDGGVLLSVVLDGIEGKSYLLALDAKTMEEVGRARVNGVVGFGFHGIHVSNDRTGKL